MAISQFLRNMSVLDLVASDFSYNSNDAILGQTLRSLPDNLPADEQPFPRGLLSSLPDTRVSSDSLFHSNDLNGVIEFDNWIVDKTFNNSRNGFGAVVFRSKLSTTDDGQFDYIVALRGSDGTDPQDWLADVDLAKNVWKEQRNALIDYIASRSNAADVHFTGQSLGGGLAPMPVS